MHPTWCVRLCSRRKHHKDHGSRDDEQSVSNWPHRFLICLPPLSQAVGQPAARPVLLQTGKILSVRNNSLFPRERDLLEAFFAFALLCRSFPLLLSILRPSSHDRQRRDHVSPSSPSAQLWFFCATPSPVRENRCAIGHMFVDTHGFHLHCTKA